MKKKKMTLEYRLVCSTQSLYRAISTSSGLGEWFAEKVIIRNDIYQFYWNKSFQSATLLHAKENTFVRFRWEDDDIFYFEFRILHQELTGDICLYITDFADEAERDDAINLWNNQVEKLKRSIGCAKK